MFFFFPAFFFFFFLFLFIGSGGHIYAAELATWGVGPDITSGIAILGLVVGVVSSSHVNFYPDLCAVGTMLTLR